MDEEKLELHFLMQDFINDYKLLIKFNAILS